MALFSRLIHFSSDAFVDQNRIGRLKTYRAAPSQTPSQTAGGRRMALFSRLIRFSSDAFVDQNRIRRLKTYRPAPWQSVLFLCYSGQQEEPRENSGQLETSGVTLRRDRHHGPGR